MKECKKINFCYYLHTPSSKVEGCEKPLPQYKTFNEGCRITIEYSSKKIKGQKNIKSKDVLHAPQILEIFEKIDTDGFFLFYLVNLFRL